MKQLLAFIRKEFYHVFRDKRTLLILFALPVVQIVLFGYALSNEVKNIGVAEVGLPPSELNSNDRDVLLKEYSIKNVFTREITAAWPGVDQGLLSAYLSSTTAPGYFSESRGFIAGGTSPGADWDALVNRLDDLGPYNPSQVSSLQLSFK